jgi:hypothetical protein
MTALPDSPPQADRYCHAWNVRGPGAGTAAMSGWLSGLPSTRAAGFGCRLSRLDSSRRHQPGRLSRRS